jgi:DNA polymerase III delta prime subunit
MPLAEMKNAKIGVEATHYLQRMIDEPPAHEPLLAALGGSPIALRQHIEEELDRWKEHQMTPLFVFEGQSTVGKEEIALRNARAALTKTQTAWELYAENQPSDAVKTFGSSSMTLLPGAKQSTNRGQTLSELEIYIHFCKKSSPSEIYTSSSPHLVLARR